MRNGASWLYGSETGRGASSAVIQINKKRTVTIIFPGVMTRGFGYNLSWPVLLLVKLGISSCKGEMQAYATCYIVLIEDYMAYIFKNGFSTIPQKYLSPFAQVLTPIQSAQRVSPFHYEL